MVAPVKYMTNTAKHNGISGLPTQLMVQHSAECPLRGGYAESLTQWSNTTAVQASWHSFVDPIVRVRQVPWYYAAWHAGYANPISYGMEIAGYARFSRAEWLTPAGLKMFDNMAVEWWEWAEQEEIPLRWLSTAEVNKVLAGNRKIKGFCTHGQISPATRYDPGPNFPKDMLMGMIQDVASGKTKPAGVVTPTSTDWLDTVNKAEVSALIDERLDLAIQRLLNYGNTTRTDRNFYALHIDGGLNATEANRKADEILRRLDGVPRAVLGYTGAGEEQDVYQKVNDALQVLLGVTPPAETKSGAFYGVGQPAGDPDGGEVEAPKVTEPVDSTPAEHTVQDGETLYSIARLYGRNPHELTALNDLKDPNLIRPGQVLKLK